MTLQTTPSTSEESTQAAIHKSLERHDVQMLRKLALSPNGLLADDLRRRSWLLLLGCSESSVDVIPQSNLLHHKDEDQVQLDVDRSTPFDKRLDIKKFRKSLFDLICRFLRCHEDLCYYQGFHDIAAVFLHVFSGDEDGAYAALEMFTLKYLRDFMMPTILESIRMLNLVPDLLKKARPDLLALLMPDSIAATPFFCLSPIVTSFTHDIHDIQSLSIIFDHIIASQSFSTVIYTYVSLIILKHEKILEKLDLGSDDVFSKEDLLHSALSKFLVGVSREDVQNSVMDSIKMMKSTPIQSLPPFSNIGKFSVLKKKPFEQLQTQKGEAYIGQSIILSQIQESETGTERSNQSALLQFFGNERNQNILKVSIMIGVVSVMVTLFAGDPY